MCPQAHFTGQKMRTTAKITKKEKEIQIIDNKHPLIFDLLTIYV